MKDKLFGYSIRDYQGELSVGVIKAKDINEVKTALQYQFDFIHSGYVVTDDDIQEIEFDSDGVCELYYGM